MPLVINFVEERYGNDSVGQGRGQEDSGQGQGGVRSAVHSER